MPVATRRLSRHLQHGRLQVTPTNRTTVLTQVRRIASTSSPIQVASSSYHDASPQIRVEPVRPAVTLHRPTPPSHQLPDDGHPGEQSSRASLSKSRKDRLGDARPFSDFLTDTFHRQHDYLRISVTERCNLRCVYCMPEEGVPLSPSKSLLTTPEIVMLSSLFVSQGVTKIRLTGGEPTVRRDIVPLMQQIGSLRAHGLRELCLTTNGLSLHRKLDAMVEAGLTGVNLSLDTLDPWQFQLMTRRAGFSAVQKTIDRILELNRAGAFIKLKINCVVMRGLNDREILPFVELTRDKDIEVRFIEYMPFDGNKWSKGKMFSYQEMLDVIRSRYPDLERSVGHKNDTSKTYQVPGFVGKLGFITSMTHNFCATCNRLRITSDGNLKVCLFGNAEVSVRDILRKVNQGEPIDQEAFEALRQAAADRTGVLPRGYPPQLIAANYEELLKVIGIAVKEKKAKHAGLGELEHMKNRPMILIDSSSTPSSYRHLTSRSLPSTLTSRSVPTYLLNNAYHGSNYIRLFSTAGRRLTANNDDNSPKLTHVSSTGAAHMVSISEKTPTKRLASAKCTVRFSSPLPLTLIRENQIKKGDVLGVARIAGIMAAKRTPDLIPLCHPIALTHAEVELNPTGEKEIEISATVSCDGKTGVEMEALTAASAAALTVYDMCKAVDKGMVVEGLRVVLKEGGRSGRWEEGVSTGNKDE
ncbi:putative molybdenum cofactor biosynthesis protein 1 B [Podospora fimiseda]|uniref:Molybdenum cofactor biosynthesis protein 1 B n=1 Tax=Podospora fimiseda TaxID=252190 RepID=A0AAN7H0J0_9PEZI|nr:putative molybdenum cofactor biosynthesis protein 1 B [Podospora fimiseda]